MKDFIDAYRTCNATNNNTSAGNNTFSANPDGLCDQGCSEKGECIDGKCYCNTGEVGKM